MTLRKRTFVATGLLLSVFIRGGGAGGGATLPFDCVGNVAAVQVPAGGGGHHVRGGVILAGKQR